MKISAPLLSFLLAVSASWSWAGEPNATVSHETIHGGGGNSCTAGSTTCGPDQSQPTTVVSPNAAVYALPTRYEGAIAEINGNRTATRITSVTGTPNANPNASPQGGNERPNVWLTGGPAPVVVEQMTAVLKRIHPDDPARVDEFVDRFRRSALSSEGGEGGGLQGNMSRNFARKWLKILGTDIEMDRVLDEHPRDKPLPAEVNAQIAPMKLERKYLMEVDGQITASPIHVNYMRKDPINERLPLADRLSHDNNAVGNFPGSAPVYQMRAESNLELGRYKEALADAAAALKLNPKSVDARLLHGAANEALGQYRDANADAKAALDIKPGDRGAMTLLQATNGRANVGEGASSGLRGIAGGGAGGGGGYSAGGAARLVPGMQGKGAMASAASLSAAERAMSLRDMRTAIDLAGRALEQNPQNASAYLLRSMAFGRLRDYERASKEASLGLKLAPGNKALLTAKALADIRRKAYRDALASANAALESDPNNAFAYAARAHAYGGLGDRDAMLADLRRAAALDARYQQALADAGNLQLPSDADILFLFPGEEAPGGAPSGAPSRKKSFGVVAAASAVGGILLALGLLQLVLAPLNEKVTSAFTKITRKGPTVGTPVATASPASVGGMVAGVIRGQYEIGRQIGAGGMGMVFEGTDRSLGRKVAIKKMRDELRVNPRERERFVIEAKTVAALHHPNIVDIFAIAEEGEDVYLVFEFVGGRTIHDLVQHSGNLAPAQAIPIVRAVADALGYAHGKGVVHRDMKPSNVMIEADGRVKVMDFGIARMAKDAMTRYSMTNTVVGTPPYMAPEQEQGVVRKESDVYALGVCAYEMLTGKLPFIGMGAGMLMNKINMSFIPPSRAIAGLPDTLDPVFEKAFQADPDNRYRTPQDFAAALEGALGGVTRRVS